MKRLIKAIYDRVPLKKPFFQLLRYLNLPKSIYKHLHFKGLIAVPVDRDHSFKIMHYGYKVENDLFWSGLTGGWEKVSLQLWIELSKDSNVILDIGANTGVYSLVAKSLNSSVSVFGFEPVERVFKKFKRNCELNHFDIQCFDFAISNYDGVATIYDTALEHTYSVTVNKNTLNNKAMAIETQIKTKKLSSFIKEHHLSKIDLIKIDVETHEAEVLEGMEEYLYRFQPTLLIEILNDEIGQKIQSILSGIDYLYFNIDEQNAPKQVEKITKSDFYNYLICKKDVAHKLKLI